MRSLESRGHNQQTSAFKFVVGAFFRAFVSNLEFSRPS